MRFTRLDVLLLTALHLPPAWANEHGGGGGEKPAGAEVPREQREYLEKSIKLKSLAGKLEEAEKHFAELVHEKREAPTAEAKVPFLKQMIEVAKHRNADVVEYNKLKTDLTLRYPGRGEPSAARPRAERSAEELEREVGAEPTLDQLLVETKRLIERKYAPLDPRPPAPTRAPAAAARDQAKPPRLRLER